MKRWRWRAGLALLPALAIAAVASGAEGDAFVGTWVRTDVEHDDAARDAEIERVTETLSFVLRGIARGVMRRAMRPPERYRIERVAGALVLRADDGDVSVVDGLPHAGGDDAVTSRLEPRGERAEIHQTWRHGDSSHGTTLWRLAESGSRLRVSVESEDSRLDGPIRYSTTYRRVDVGP